MENIRVRYRLPFWVYFILSYIYAPLVKRANCLVVITGCPAAGKTMFCNILRFRYPNISIFDEVEDVQLSSSKIVTCQCKRNLPSLSYYKADVLYLHFEKMVPKSMKKIRYNP